MSDTAGNVTRLLHQWNQGDTQARERLVERVYHELKNIARSQLAQERRGHTLQPTALVHEAYLKLDKASEIDWQDRVHFIAVAARVMRQVLVDRGRARQALKRDGGQQVTLLTGMHQTSGQQTTSSNPVNVDLMALDQAMHQLEQINADQARIIELRYFGGLTIEETAQVMQQSTATVNRNWRAARAWLYQELSASGELNKEYGDEQ